MIDKVRTMLKDRRRELVRRSLDYLFFSIIIYAYSAWLAPIRMGGHLWLEIPILLYLFFTFQGIFRDHRFKAVLSTLPVLSLYIIHDAYLLVFGKVPRLVEVKQIPELAAAADAVLMAGVLLPAASIICLFLFNVDRNKYRNYLLRNIPLSLLILALLFQPAVLANAVEKYGKVVKWSEVKSARKTGRITMALYYEAKRRVNTARLSEFRDISKLGTRISDNVLGAMKPRDIHLIVLESFIDPSLFNGLAFDRPPAHEAFDRLVGDNISLSVSPVFAGGTARAEFEILCGVPSFGTIDGIEFNVFTGAATYCLPEILSGLGYRTVASIATSPKYYNSTLAYQGMGFREQYFPKEFVPKSDTYLELDDTVGKQHLFDGSLLSQNHAFISGETEEKRPVLNYVLGMYGHHYFYRNEEKRPPVISTGSGVDEIERLVNQYHYRTKAIADYLEALMKDGREHMIVIVSDHLPTLVKGIRGRDLYDELGYLNNVPRSKFHNQLIIVRNGQFVKYEKMQHFNIYRVVLDYLSDGAYCREQVCDFDSPDSGRFEDDYMTILGLASR
jgi:phosphoglycerol transferase MdoB-like AlkP superfamily enzyme